MIDDAEDVEAIRRILARFCQYLDDGNLEGTLSLFTDDAKVVSRGEIHDGRDAVRKFLEGFFTSTPPENKWLHFLSDAVIKINDDGVTGEGRINMSGYRSLLVGRWSLDYVNRHHDRYRKVNGQWLFAEKGMEARGTYRRQSTAVSSPLSISFLPKR